MYSQNFAVRVRRILGAMLSAALIFTAVWGSAGAVLPVHAEETAKGSLNVIYHSQAEISARMKSDGVSLRDPLNFAVEPQCVSPYGNAGVPSQETLNSAMKMMNQIRFIAGLSDNVILNAEYNNLAQAASMVNYANRSLSHYPSKPAGMDDAVYDLGARGSSSSNIAMASWRRSLNETIALSWMEDGDSSNIDRVGHRRWILNPTMGQTGFGVVYGPNGTYSALYCFDRSNDSAWQTQVAWPAQNMPIQYFDSYFPWSVSMGRNVDKNAVQVSMTRVRDGMTWNFSAGGGNGYFNVDNGGYGQKGCIIFRPDGIDGYQAGDTFAVTIKGDGIDLAYTVNFFDPDNVQREDMFREVDWVSANALLDTVPEGGVANVSTGCRFEVPAETLNKVAGRNILCAFHIDDELVLSIPGMGVQSLGMPWNVVFSYQSAIPKELRDQIKAGAAATCAFELAGSGAVPASVNIHIGWSAEQAGKQAILYRYDDLAGAFAEAGRFSVLDNGQSVFAISGGGHYIAVIHG